MFAGVHITFLPMHLLGLMGMPRRVWTYLPDRGWDLPNLISTVGAAMTAVAVILWIIDMARNFRPFGEREAGDIWQGPGLEWVPTGLYSLRSIPVIKSRDPLWTQPGLAKAVVEGRYFLPNSATGRRETLVTSTLNAEPQYLQRMPVPSGWPIWAALFTAGAFLLLTVQAYWAFVVSAILAVYCVMSWCWTLDQPVDQETADIGAGIRVPTYVTGPSGHGWWAMVLTLTVAGMVLLLMGFSYIFLWSRNPADWAPPPGITSLAQVVALNVAALALAWLSCRVLRISGRRAPLLATTLMVLAVLLAAGGWGADWVSWRATGLDPVLSAQGAMIYAALAWNGFFTGVSLLMGVYVVLRLVARLVVTERPTTFDLVGLFVGYTAVQSAALALLVRLFPGA
jgi:cytochrome c oxidase subunit I+III